MEHRGGSLRHGLGVPRGRKVGHQNMALPDISPPDIAGCQGHCQNRCRRQQRDNNFSLHAFSSVVLFPHRICSIPGLIRRKMI